MEKRKIFQETAKAFLDSGKGFRPFRPFPQAQDRAAYEKLPAELCRIVIDMGEAYLGYRYPWLSAACYMLFEREGDRGKYEGIYFDRRYALNALVAAECVEYQGRFLDDIVNGIIAICEESAWQVPAHNNRRGEHKECLPDTARPILDLFACETGAQLACIYYLLGRELDTVSPMITKRIRLELEHRIFVPYLNEHFWWMGSEEERMGNWTSWCTSNVLYAAFLSATACEAVPAGQEEKCWESGQLDERNRAILRKAAISCDYFTRAYGEDGCCEEGAHYYHHAGLRLGVAADIMNQVTEGAFSSLLQCDKMKNIAAYILNVHVADRYYFNFGDGSAVLDRAGVGEYLFGKNTGQLSLMRFAAQDFARRRPEELFTDDLRNLPYRMQTIFCYEEVMGAGKDNDTNVSTVRKDVWYASVGLFLTRNAVFDLAVKAGNNGERHNHNDTGSFILYKNGRPVFVDIGVESYSQKTFSPQRYEIWTMQSGYHNLPAIEGTDQQAGSQYASRNMEVDMDTGGEKSAVSMELAGAYPLTGTERSYVRKIVFDKKENQITLTDHTDSDDVVLNFITYEKPQIKENTMKIGDGEVVFRGAKEMTVEALPVTDENLRIAWDHELYRIRLRMCGDTFEMIIR